MTHDVLIVDDEADIRMLIGGILEDEGYSTRGVARGVAFVFEHACDQHADVGFVVDDQDVMRHG